MLKRNDLVIHRYPGANSVARRSGRWELRLLGGFELRAGSVKVELAASVERVVAFVALQRNTVLRGHVAGVLWPDKPEERANANLRAAIWRLRKRRVPVVEASQSHLSFSDAARVDISELHKVARTLAAGSAPASIDQEITPSDFFGELLPDWYDDWVIIERERVRQLCLNGLESLAEQLQSSGRYGEAVDAAMAAIMVEPFRESAHRKLINIHLAEGNHFEAARQYFAYKDMLHRELAADPTEHMERLASLIGQGARQTVNRAAGRYSESMTRWRTKALRESAS